VAVFDAEPAQHPDDRDDRVDEAGPWLAVLGASAVGWVVLAAFDWRLLAEGTLLWATTKSLATLVFAPLAAAALVQDTRSLGVGGVEVGPSKWLYAAVALFFPPVGVLYLCHRHVLVGRRGSSLD
jgi:hypothetical protein